MRNRQKDEITRDILYSAQGGVGITRIMFHAYLTHSQAKEYTKMLLNQGLLEQDVESGSLRQFRTTPKGAEYLAAVERMSVDQLRLVVLFRVAHVLFYRGE
jgi:predicted transcriptional regulator